MFEYDVTEEQQLVSFEDEFKTYNLIKFRRTNQDTCINLNAAVKKGRESCKRSTALSKVMQLKMVNWHLDVT